MTLPDAAEPVTLPSSRRPTWVQVGILVSSALVAVGSFLPWEVEHSFISETWLGVAGQALGIGTLVLALISIAAASLAVVRKRPTPTLVSLGALSVSFGVSAAVAVPILRASTVGTGQTIFSLSMGAELWICLVASAMGCAFCMQVIAKAITFRNE